jgi:hypothetical protein
VGRWYSQRWYDQSAGTAFRGYMEPWGSAAVEIGRQDDQEEEGGYNEESLGAGMVRLERVGSDVRFQQTS